MELESISLKARLICLAIGVPFILSRLKFRSYWTTLLLCSVLAYFSFFESIEALRSKHPGLQIYSLLGLPRGFSAEEHRLKKREVFLYYHPDRSNKTGDSEALMRKFTEMQNKLDLLQISDKRELLDRYNYDFGDKPIDAE